MFHNWFRDALINIDIIMFVIANVKKEVTIVYYALRLIGNNIDFKLGFCFGIYL